MTKLALIVALETELPNPPEGFTVYYCGVGKVNAAYTTMKAIAEGATKVVNFGTAGLVKHNKGLEGLVQVTDIVQRDMNAEPQAPRGSTPFETYDPIHRINNAPEINDHGPIKLVKGDNIIRLGTGDSFVMDIDPWFNEARVDIVDMEAYAIAKVCAMEGVEFECWKWISDFADENAAETWEENQSAGANAFLDLVKKRQ